MGMFGFGKRTKHRSFEYIPRYYDPAKEELEERLKKYKLDPDKPADGSFNPELMKSRIRGGYRRNSRSGNEYYKTSARSSNMRLLMITALLILATIYFMSEYLPKFISYFEG